MGTVGGLIGPRDEEREARLAVGLAASPRSQHASLLTVGRCSIGVTGGNLGDGYLARGTAWSVAVCGVVDSVEGESRPNDPAKAIAHCLDRKGLDAARSIIGDFNCVATDGDRLVAFRDHIGTDGLFVGSDGSSMAVMSEPKQVLGAVGRSRAPDIDALVSIFFSQWHAEDDVPCPVSHVDRVPRGYVIEAGGSTWTKRGRTWDPTPGVETAEMSQQETQEAAWAAIEAAVERSIVGPTAVSLSGGIDSTAIASALVSVHPETRIGAISAVYPDSPSVDESRYIAETASFLDLESITYDARPERLEDMETWVDKFDGPTHGLAISAINALNDVARESGFETVLSGEMAELVYDLREHAIGRMLLRGRMGPAFRNLRQLRGRGVPWTSLARVVGSTLTPSPLALAYSRRQPVDPPASWLETSFMPGLESRWDFERSPSNRWKDIQVFFATGPSYPGLELSTLLGDLAGVRTRRPLIDREIWEFFLTLSPEAKFPDAWTKSLVRHALSGRAPESVIWRTDKTVFDEDAKRNADYPGLTSRVMNGFELPGVDYAKLSRRLESRDMVSFELAMVRSLASIHAFVAVA